MAMPAVSAVDVVVSMAPTVEVSRDQLEETAFDVLEAVEGQERAAGPVVSVDLEKSAIRLLFTLDEAANQAEVGQQVEQIMAAVVAVTSVAPVSSAKATHEIALSG